MRKIEDVDGAHDIAGEDGLCCIKLMHFTVLPSDQTIGASGVDSDHLLSPSLQLIDNIPHL